jgi:hypothetical protein
MEKNTAYLPHLGKLSIAILESRMKTLIGDEAINVLKEPMKEKRLQDGLADALVKTEQRFAGETEDVELREAILTLPVADLQPLRDAVRKFYDRPSESSLAKILKEQLEADYPTIDLTRIDIAVAVYLKILREELVSVNDEVRHKLIALAILGIQQNLEQIAESDRFYKQYAQAPLLSQNIRVREFQALVRERTKNFIGRDFIFNAIDDILKDPVFPSGYIVISGEPGVGKTALVAQLVKTRGYVHHFNIASQNIRSVRDFLANICAQLIVRFALNHTFLPENAAKDSGFLVQLLAEAAEKHPGERIVILIDALDEAEDFGLVPNANRLYLPLALPPGVFIILTTREKAEYRLLVDHRKDIYLQDDDPANLADVRDYVKAFINQHKGEMSDRIARWGIEEEEFVNGITEKSQGNFMYLVHVLCDIQDGRLTPENIDNIHKLPLGLREYYQRHWRAMRDLDKDRFEKYQKPVICILATIHEPVTVDIVCELTQLAPMIVKDVIAEWREFLNEDKNKEGMSLYRVYHTSFQDFLQDEVGLKPYHNKIADLGLRKIMG